MLWRFSPTHSNPNGTSIFLLLISSVPRINQKFVAQSTCFSSTFPLFDPCLKPCHSLQISIRSQPISFTSSFSLLINCLLIFLSFWDFQAEYFAGKFVFFFLLVSCSCFVICGVFPLLGLVNVLFFLRGSVWFWVERYGIWWNSLFFDGWIWFLYGVWLDLLI